MLKRHTFLQSRSALKPSKLDKSGPLRKRSKSKRAVTKASLWRELSAWARESPCAKCGSASDHAHHIVTKGSDASLYLCPLAVMPICATCHDFAHGSPEAFGHWLEILKPGLKDYLKSLGRSAWFHKPLDEAAEAIREAKKRPWSAHWEGLLCE